MENGTDPYFELGVEDEMIKALQGRLYAMSQKDGASTKEMEVIEKQIAESRTRARALADRLYESQDVPRGTYEEDQDTPAMLEEGETKPRMQDGFGPGKLRMRDVFTRNDKPGDAAFRRSSVARGMMDPISGGAQFLEKSLPQSWSKKINQFNNALVDRGVPLDRMPEGGFDEFLRKNEARYQAERAVRGKTGADWGRLAGNVLSPANLALASRVPQAISLLGRMAAFAVGGAASGAMMPATGTDPFFEEKAKQVALGGAVGAASPLIMGVASRLVRPKSNEEVQALLRMGVSPTPGQVLGGPFKTTEEKMTSLPLVGDAIRSGQRRALTQYNTAGYNRALAPIGDKLPNNITGGSEALNYVSDALGKKYDGLLPKLSVRVDRPFRRSLTAIRKEAGTWPAEHRDQLERIIKNEVESRFDNFGRADGQSLKNIESKLGNIAKGAMQNQDYDKRNLGIAVRDIQESLRDAIKRQNKSYGGELAKINTAFARYKRLENAMTYKGVDDELFTPANFRSAVKKADITKDKKAFANRRAIDQDFASAGEKVLSQRYPDSGTAGRTMLNALAIGGGYAVHPGTLAAAGLASVPYAPYVQGGIARLLAQRNSPMYGQIADVLKQSGPYVNPALTGYGNQAGLLNSSIDEYQKR